MLTRLLLCYSTNRRTFLLLSLASLAMLLLLAPIRKNSDSGGRLAEVGSLETNRGERKLGRGDPVKNPKLSKNLQNGPEHPDDQEVPEKMENRGSSSVAGEILELSGNSVGLSLSGEEPEESEIGENLFSPGERGPPRLIVPSEKSVSDPEEVEEDFLALHHLQFSALLEGGTNMGNFSTADWELFMAYKEAQYEQRRLKIGNFCKEHGEVFGEKIHPNALVMADKYRAGYCQIAKVASSTFCRHFIDLAGVSEREKKRWADALQMFAPQLWPPPKKEELEPAWKKLTSIVIVRHPFARLASVYYQKFVELKEHKAWGPLVKSVVRKYRRPNPNSGDPTLATPSEFLSFILDDLKNRGGEDVDQHWRPQHLSCPFCTLPFTVYAHMEELSEDSAYFFTKANLTKLIDPARQLNRASSKGSREPEFWSEVGVDLLEKLEEAYSNDLDMFGYSVQEYIDSLDLDIVLGSGDLPKNS